MADLIPPMLIKLQADVSELKVGLAQAESAIKGVDNSVATASTGMTNFIGKMKQVGASIGIAFAGTQVLQFGRDVIAQAMEAEAQQQRLAQLMKVSVGATNEQIAALNAQADALEKVGVVTGGNITQTQSQLATFNLQYETIQRMTPAILDYVTAEKGANASADEFKQMTNGLAQALNGNFGSLTRVGFVLDDHTKKLISSGTEAERSAAIVDVLNSTYKGFNEELRKTPAGQMQALRNDFDKLKEDLGKALLPALGSFMSFLTGSVIPALRSFGKFISENADAIKMYAIILATGVTAFYAVRGAIVATQAAMVVYTAVTKSMAAGHTLAAIATLNFRGAMMMLNMAIKANPIGAIITALTILGAAFVFAWKKSETFREIVIKGVQIIVTGFAYLLQGVGKFIGLFAKMPGMGWAKGIADGAKKASESIKETSKNLSDLKGTVKAGYGEGAFTYGSQKPSGGGGGGGGGGGLTDKEKAKLAKIEKYKKDVLKIYKDMNDAMADGQYKAEKELEQRNDRMIEAQKNYDETVFEARKRYQETIEDAEKNHAERVEDLQYRFNDIKEKAEKRYNETVLEANIAYGERTAEIQQEYEERKTDLQKKYLETLEKAQKAYDEKNADLQAKYEDTKAQAQKRYDKAALDATERKQKAEDTAEKRFKDTKLQTEKDYAKKVFDLNANLEKKLADLRENAAKKSTDLTKSATEKQLGIVQQSIDRLRNAFSSKTGFDLGAAFGEEGANASTLLESLKKSLTAAKTLQANAGALAGMGYSQLFIEEVVKQGPEAGNKIADALKSASPAATAELQSLYGQINTVSTTGLDALAASMNQGGRLATKELTDAYHAVSSDLALALADVEKQLQTNLAEVNSAYEVAVTEAKAIRDEKLADAATALKEALATAKTAYDASIADAKETLAEALATAKKNLDEGLADALKALNEAKAAAQKDLDEGLAAADKTYTEALAKAKKALDETLAAAKKALTDAMAEAQKDLDKGLADAAKALTEAREKAQKDLAERLADAQKTLQDALIKAQKDYETAIDAITKATEDKLASLKTKLAEVAANIAALGAAQAAANALANAPIIKPVVPGAVVGGGNPLELLKKNEAATNITINTTNLTDPSSVAAAVSSEIKFGAVVTATTRGAFDK